MNWWLIIVVGLVVAGVIAYLEWRQYVCRFCHRVFGSRRERDDHLLTHLEK